MKINVIPRSCFKCPLVWTKSLGNDTSSSTCTWSTYISNIIVISKNHKTLQIVLTHFFHIGCAAIRIFKVFLIPVHPNFYIIINQSARLHFLLGCVNIPSLLIISQLLWLEAKQLNSEEIKLLQGVHLDLNLILPVSANTVVLTLSALTMHESIILDPWKQT